MLGLSLLATAFLLAGNMPRANADTVATLSLDKPDYSPGDMVAIHGSGFLAGSAVTLSVDRSDSTVYEWVVISEANGNFSTSYVADAQSGDHVFKATDGINAASAIYPDPTSAIAFHVGPHAVAAGGNLNWQLAAACVGPITGALSCVASGTTAGGPVPDGYKVRIDMQPGDSCDFTSLTALVSTTTVGGNASGSFAAPTSLGTFCFRAFHVNQVNLGTGAQHAEVWAQSQSNTQVVTVVPTGTLVVVKNAVGGDGTFSFTSPSGGGLPGIFSITTTGGTGSQSFTVNAGAYSVSETVPAGWKLESSACSSGSPSNFAVPAGGTATCSFTDSALGTVVLTKNTVGGDDSFAFSATGATLASSFPLTLTTTGGTASQTLSGIDPDNTYSLSEAVTEGWTLVGSSCSSGTPASFTVAPGGTTTCTFNNVGRFQFTFSQAGSGSPVTVSYHFSNGTAGSGTAPFSVWVDASSTNTLSYSYQTPVPGSAGTRYVLTLTNLTQPVALTGPATITGTYQTQYQLTLDAGAASALASVTPPSGSPDWYDLGTAVTYTGHGAFGRSAGTGTRATSWYWDSDSHTAVSTASNFASSPMPMNGSHTVHVTLTTQHQITFLASPTIGGTATAGTSPTIAGDTGWYDSGTSVSISASASLGYAFMTWSGTGAGSYTGTNNPATAAMNAAVGETANFRSCNVPNKEDANLKGANLANCNLAGYNLSGDNLQNANLQGANIQGANLNDANLKGANLSGANGQGANFQDANLSGASLIGGNFMNAIFKDANLNKSNLSHGIFSHANFQDANLNSSNMSYSDFSYADFTGANTNKATITGANFTGAINPPGSGERGDGGRGQD